MRLHAGSVFTRQMITARIISAIAELLKCRVPLGQYGKQLFGYFDDHRKMLLNATFHFNDAASCWFPFLAEITGHDNRCFIGHAGT